MMIPKVIHYCWFGGKPLPDIACKCIESWKKFCPDYEIREWNEENYDINQCEYTREAFKAKKWAFISDYARFDILFQYGGIYFDTDVEIIKPIDEILHRGAFMGCELGGGAPINPGLGMGAEPGMAIYKEILDEYNNAHFLFHDVADLKTVGERTSAILKQHGYIESQQVTKVCGITIYPWDYFCPINYSTGEITLTNHTYTIHHYHASWQGSFEKIQMKLQRYFSTKGLLLRVLGKVIIIPFKIMKKIERVGVKGTMKEIIFRFKRSYKR